jgi:UrcA family protein
MNRFSLGVALTWAATAGLAATAAEPESASVTVETQLIDMNSAAGRREAASLARRLAMRLCSRYSNEVRVDDRENYFACVKNARVQVRTVTALRAQGESLLGVP